MVNAILAKRVNHIVTKGDNPAWPKGSKSRGFSSIKQFGFHYAEEVFSHGIVKTIAFSGHTLDYIVILKTLSVSEVLILPSLIRMYYKPVKIIGVLRAALSAPRK